jgi:tetratricopeptide (TPR) repeat protein
MKVEHSNPLTAFFDLQVCPITFDFVVFAALAEMERVRRDCATIHYVIVPGDKDGFREDDLTYDLSQKQWRILNIVLPGCWLFGGHVSVSVCANREEALQIEERSAGPIFPEAYSVHQPVGDFLWSGVTAAAACGEPIPHVRPSPQATDFIRTWLGNRTDGKRPVAITLRESSHGAVRNSNIEDWIGFARTLDTETYCPIFVRDTERFGEPPLDDLKDFVICEAASLHIDLRVALYEQSWLNLVIPNGPGVLGMLSGSIRFIMFKMLTEEFANTSTGHVQSLGFKIGGQVPHATPFQRLVWEPDDSDVIQREFVAMADRIDANDGDNDVEIGDRPLPMPENQEDPMEVALRLQITGRFEEATAIYQDIVGKNPDNADAWHLLGVIAHQADRPEAAEKMILRAIGLTGGQANYFVNLAAVLKKAERLDEATNCLWRAVALTPNDAGAYADLADLLAEMSDGDKAKSAMLKALKLKPDSIDICERAGQLFHNTGDIEIAANLYRQALDLREKAAQRRFEARERLPEIPVQTLKTA